MDGIFHLLHLGTGINKEPTRNSITTGVLLERVIGLISGRVYAVPRPCPNEDGWIGLVAHTLVKQRQQVGRDESLRCNILYILLMSMP